jgi:hypothetical protein
MKKEIISQYRAALEMLEDVIHKCPDDLWDKRNYESAYWRIVYHILFYTALYLDPKNHVPYKDHKPNYNRLGTVNDKGQPVIIGKVYSKEEMLWYTDSIYHNCEDAIMQTEIEEDSSIEWLSMSNGEMHLYNIRHIQHHIGQLTERLHQNGIRSIRWEGSGME